MTYNSFKRIWESEEAYILCHTSGSTGKPKDIRLSKNVMRESAKRTNNFFSLDNMSHLHSCISPDYIGGKMMMVRASILNCKFTYEEPSNRPLDNYNDSDIDLLAVVPSQMWHILKNINKSPAIRNIIVGGQPISDELRFEIAKSKLNVWETYGMTETASHIALRKVNKEPTPFKLFDGISISKDSDSRLVIKIAGQDELITNDIVEIVDDQNFYIRGRADNVIICGGIKIYPEEIERVIESELNTEVIVKGEKDLKWGEVISLIVPPSLEGFTDDHILEICKNNLESYSVPKRIVREHIPHTENGKKIRY